MLLLCLSPMWQLNSLASADVFPHCLHLYVIIFSRNADSANRFGRNSTDARHHALAMLVSNAHLGQQMLQIRNTHNRRENTDFQQQKRVKYPKRLPLAAFSSRRQGWVPGHAQTLSRVDRPGSFFFRSFVNGIYFTSGICPFFLDWAVCHCHLQLWPQFLCRKSCL